MTNKKENKSKEDIREFDKNPYDPENKKPEDIVRLFYEFNVPIIPVVSKRGMLIGILKKEDLISELSDIERVENLNIDKFITKLTKKFIFDDLLPYGKIKEFIIINIFGDIQGKWTRLQLFISVENPENQINSNKEVEKQKEEQILEWIIYTVLEHIPRALYAVNDKGKTIFYNNHFEEIYREALNTDVDTGLVEKTIKSSSKNELISKINREDLYFYNKELKVYYEKIPLLNDKKKIGFLIFCNKESPKAPGLRLPGVSIKDLTLNEMLTTIERQLIVDSINKNNNDFSNASNELKISKKSLQNKIKKYNITLNSNNKVTS